MEVMRKEIMDGAAILVITLGRGSVSIMVFRYSCRFCSASVI